MPALDYDPADAWDDKCHRCGGVVWYGDRAEFIGDKQLHFDCMTEDEKPRCVECGEDVDGKDYVRLGVDKFAHEGCLEDE